MTTFSEVSDLLTRGRKNVFFSNLVHIFLGYLLCNYVHLLEHFDVFPEHS